MWLPFAAFILLLLPACSTQPTDNPLNTAPIPDNAQPVESCTPLGVMACNAMSALSGDAAVERRSACFAYRRANGSLVEQCGSRPISQP